MSTRVNISYMYEQSSDVADEITIRKWRCALWFSGYLGLLMISLTWRY